MERRTYREEPIRDSSHYHIYHGIVGNSPAIQRVVKTIQMVKDSPLPVLICGESGTGKELVARAIHFDGIRKAKPFVIINCASLKPELWENELLGHVEGVFAGAAGRKDGLLRVADGGTLFIDAIGDIDIRIQAGLLRVVENGVIRPLISTREIKVDVRIVTATNRDIDKEVDERRFHKDLYHRLNVCRIDMPPLRERKDDIPLLVNHFLLTSPLARTMDSTITPDAVDILLEYRWPGNIRELFNVLTRAILLSNGPVVTRELITSFLQERGYYTEPRKGSSLLPSKRDGLIYRPSST